MSISIENKIGLDWGATLSVWWSHMWRTLIYAVLLGAAVGFVAGLYAGLSGAPEKGVFYGAIGGWFAYFPASLFALKQALSKHVSTLAKFAE